MVEMIENKDLHKLTLRNSLVSILFVIFVILNYFDVFTTLVDLKIGLSEGNVFMVLLVNHYSILAMILSHVVSVSIFGFWLLYALYVRKKKPNDSEHMNLLILSSLLLVIGFQSCVVYNNFMMMYMRVIQVI